MSMCEGVPNNLSEWEAALTRHFLMISGDEIGPIRSFDICADTLALAAGVGPDARDDAVTSFRKALMAHKSVLLTALEQGDFPRLSNADCLGCFIYLALTIYVDSQLASDDERGAEFRSKLADFLGVDRRFSDLHGVRVMWERLRDWLVQQMKKGKPFRRLILPEENGWTHIGYSARLSFPSRRDKTFLTNFFADHPNTPGRAANRPRNRTPLRRCGSRTARCADGRIDDRSRSRVCRASAGPKR
jgi:hypothetical protein